MFFVPLLLCNRKKNNKENRNKQEHHCSLYNSSENDLYFPFSFFTETSLLFFCCVCKRKKKNIKRMLLAKFMRYMLEEGWMGGGFSLLSMCSNSMYVSFFVVIVVCSITIHMFMCLYYDVCCYCLRDMLKNKVTKICLLRIFFSVFFCSQKGP